MKRTMVQYKVKTDCAEENEAYIAQVFEQLEREKPSGLRYAAFKLQDRVSFVHIVSHETIDGQNPLAELSAFKAFIAGIKERCLEPPTIVELDEIGSFGVFNG